MFNNVLWTNLTPLQNTHQASHGWPNQPFIGTWPETQPTNVMQTQVGQKRPKRHRTAFTTDQVLELEYYYRSSRYIKVEIRSQLAKKLNLSERCIRIWFQNRRMKDKNRNYNNDSASDRQTCRDVGIGSVACNNTVIDTIDTHDTRNEESPPPPYSSAPSDSQSIRSELHWKESITETVSPDIVLPSFEPVTQLTSEPAHSSTSPCKPFTEEANVFPTTCFPTKDFLANSNFCPSSF